MRTEALLAVAALAAAAAACQTDEPVEATFDEIVARVIEPRCTFSSCHAVPTNAAKLDLSPEVACDALVNQPSCLFPDRMRIVPGRPQDSFFLHKLTGEGLDETPTGDCASETNFLMPFGASALTGGELALVHDWIAAGAQCRPGEPEVPVTPAGPTIATLTASHLAPLAGETVAFHVTLDQAAPEGGLQIFLEHDSAALSAPLQVSVPAGEKTARFDAFASRPTSRFALRARLGESTKELVLRVAGLDIAEVLADPIGDDDGLQWIKLHNTSSVPIALDGYKLQAGQGNYDAITVDLAGTVPAGACAVIGGPIQSGANNEPIFAQVVNFTPDLPHAGGQAVGFAVFDATAPRVGGVATPVDTVLVGDNNAAQLRGPDAEIASPSCGTPIAGTSALRTGPGTCVQAEMQPRTCP